MTSGCERIIGSVTLPLTPFTDETIDGLSLDEVFAELDGLRDRGERARLQVRSADDREIVAQVNGVIEEVSWDPYAPTLVGSRVIEVRGESGWVIRVPERDFETARIWLVCGGLSIGLDGYRVDAGPEPPRAP